jgi:hypothetical protein
LGEGMHQCIVLKMLVIFQLQELLHYTSEAGEENYNASKSSYILSCIS